MKNRRAFLAAFGTSGFSLALASSARSEPGSPPPAQRPPRDVAPAPSAKPPKAGAKPPSAAAAAVAATMRRFDPKLSDAEIETIAHGIDDNASSGARLDPKKKRLNNGDEPVTIFTVPFA